ncbi:MAG: dihydroorotase [Clostridia bacterium]|nr:dihydroorotase [Clostridia bacterium]
MDYIFKNCKVYRDGNFVSEDIGVCGGVFAPVVSDEGATVIDCSDKYILPGFADVHVHLREPGFIYKETVESGSLAAAAGGYTTVCSMPNLSPAPDSPENLEPQLEAIRKTAHINVLPYGTITKSQSGLELSDMEALAPFVAGFSDDGKGVQNEEMMLAAMEKAKALDKIIAAHCEDNSLLHGGYIHDGEYAKAHGHRGICSESEWGPIKRDLELAAKTGCKYHVCHISTKESVELIRQAKKNGVDVTCETGPHYLLLDDSDLREEGRFKMNPPLRSKEDKKALIEGIIDGTIDMIATDHAPHSAEEKSRGLEKSLMGVVGIETAFPLLYTYFVRTGIIGMDRLIELMHTAPCKRFGFGGDIEIGAPADFTVYDLDEKYTINPDEFVSMGKSTPFEGFEVYGRCLMTVCGGKIAWKRENL